MTLSQLRAFALVVRLGSLRAAAAALGVSEPAVSAALTALRQDLGDPLFVRAGGGIAFTPGGRALADHAHEIVGLADQARRDVANAGEATGSLHVRATAAFEEHAAAALLDAFTRRVPGSVVELTVDTGDAFGPALIDRSADITLGSRPLAADDRSIEAVAFLRYQRIVVAAPTHPLAREGGSIPIREVLEHPWLTGPAGIEEYAEEGRWVARLPALPRFVSCTSETDALAAVRAGEGVTLALGHVVRADLRSGALVRLPVVGTPIAGLWHASTLGNHRATTAARILQRFVTTPDATAAMVAPVGAPRTARPASAVRVELWS